MADYTAARISELEPFYKGLFLKARAGVGARSFGLAVVELTGDDHPDHDHPDQEEVYVVLDGTGTLEIEGGAETVQLDRDTIVRVGPGTKRRIRSDGPMRLLAIGGVPGQPYEPPGYSEAGAPDPLD